MEYPRQIPVIFQEMRYLRYIPGIELHDKAIFLLVSMHVSHFGILTGKFAKKEDHPS